MNIHQVLKTRLINTGFVASGVEYKASHDEEYGNNSWYRRNWVYCSKGKALIIMNADSRLDFPRHRPI